MFSKGVIDTGEHLTRVAYAGRFEDGMYPASSIDRALSARKAGNLSKR
jgi:hypothetical protein